MHANQYIRGFDGLRAIAVGLVLAAHSGIWEALDGTLWFDRYVYPLVLGENGVLIFFALSGFLITRLLLKEQQDTGTVNYRFFLMRRVLRLLPAFTIFWAILLLLTLGGWYDIPPESFVFAACYVYNFIPKHFYSGYFGLTWSLGVEEQFYFLWPLVLKAIPRISLRQGITWVVTSFLLAALLFMAIVPQISLPELALSVDGEAVNLGNYTIRDAFFPYRWFIPMGSYLLLGCLAATWADHDRLKNLNNSWILLGALGLFLSPLYLHFLGYFPQKLLQTCGITLFLLFVFLRQGHPIITLLSLSPLKHLGKISYGLYLYSGIFLATGIATPEHWWQEQPVALFSTYAVAFVSYYSLERFFLAKKARFRV